MEGETYKCKYQLNFAKDANCVVMNDPVFKEPVTLVAGAISKKGLPRSSQQIREAIERLDQEGIIKDGVLWFAIYRVLTEKCNYSQKKTDFCDSISQLGLQIQHPCVYNNWRNYCSSLLNKPVSDWEQLKFKATAAEKNQIEVGVKLMEYLGY